MSPAAFQADSPWKILESLASWPVSEGPGLELYSPHLANLLDATQDQDQDQDQGQDQDHEQMVRSCRSAPCTPETPVSTLWKKIV